MVTLLKRTIFDETRMFAKGFFESKVLFVKDFFKAKTNELILIVIIVVFVIAAKNFFSMRKPLMFDKPIAKNFNAVVKNCCSETMAKDFCNKKAFDN